MASPHGASTFVTTKMKRRESGSRRMSSRPHWLNAYSMTIPDGETFIIQTIKKYLDKILEPLLLRQA
jgi:predicted metal-dependent hydrolase